MHYGRLEDGRTVERYALRAGDLGFEAITYGATIVSIWVPDRNGARENVVLHFNTLDEYVNQGSRRGYAGATIGRYAGRIAQSRFLLNGTVYMLAANEGANTLHGGVRGFDTAVWRVADAGPQHVVFTHSSPHGDQGFPGQLDVRVAYRLNERGLRIDYAAVSQQDTVVNLTNHSYFNLQGRGTIAGQAAQIFASAYVPVDDRRIPTGEIADVGGTRYDFRAPRSIGTVPYDTTFVLDKGGQALERAALAGDPVSGRVLEVHTTEPALQFYSGNPHGFAMETQHFPDSPNQPHFPTTVLLAGEPFSSTTLLLFSMTDATRAQASPTA